MIRWWFPKGDSCPLCKRIYIYRKMWKTCKSYPEPEADQLSHVECKVCSSSFLVSGAVESRRAPRRVDLRFCPGCRAPLSPDDDERRCIESAHLSWDIRTRHCMRCGVPFQRSVVVRGTLHTSDHITPDFLVAAGAEFDVQFSELDVGSVPWMIHFPQNAVPGKSFVRLLEVGKTSPVTVRYRVAHLKEWANAVVIVEGNPHFDRMLYCLPVPQVSFKSGDASATARMLRVELPPAPRALELSEAEIRNFVKASHAGEALLLALAQFDAKAVVLHYGLPKDADPEQIRLEPWGLSFRKIQEIWGSRLPSNVRVSDDLEVDEIEALDGVDKDPPYGVLARPKVVVGLPVTVTVTIRNHSKYTVKLSTDPVESSHPEKPRVASAKGVFTSEVCVVSAQGSTKLEFTITPQREEPDPSVWTFEVPVVEAPSSQTVLIQVPFKKVPPQGSSQRMFYDFGTSNIAIASIYGETINVLKEPETDSFIRSRVGVLWARKDYENPRYTTEEVPFSDARREAPDFAQRFCGYAIIETLKTDFRLNSLTPTRVIRVPNVVPAIKTHSIYQAFAPVDTLFESVQGHVARFVINALQTPPKLIFTAFPVMLRGERRREALRLIRKAFTEAISNVHSSPHPAAPVEVSARLDEATAAAIPRLRALWLQSKDERESGKFDREIAVIDIGGGTTDISVFRTERPPGHKHVHVRCIGFDGIGRGGRWITHRVAAMIASRIPGVPLEARGDAEAGELPALDPHDVIALHPLAEMVKRKFHNGEEWSVPDERNTAIPYAEEIAATCRSPALQAWVRAPTPVRIVAGEFFKDERIRVFIDEVVERTKHAANCHMKPGGESRIDELILGGQASCGLEFTRVVYDKFGLTPEQTLSAQERKRLVIDGLRAHADILGEEAEQYFDVGLLERGVLVPVGRPNQTEAVLPRFHPINVPATYVAEDRMIDNTNAVIQPLARVRPPGSGAGREIGTAQQPPEMKNLLQLNWTEVLRASPDERRRLLGNHHYCVWVDENDHLRGALYKKLDSPTASPETAEIDACPILGTFERLFQRARPNGSIEFGKLHAERPEALEEKDQSFLEHRGWTSMIIPREAMFDGSDRHWHAEEFSPLDNGRPLILVMQRATRDGPRAWFPVAQSTLYMEVSYEFLARSLASMIVGWTRHGSTIVRGVQLPSAEHRALKVAYEPISSPVETMGKGEHEHVHHAGGDSMNRPGCFVVVDDVSTVARRTVWQPSPRPDKWHLFPNYREIIRDVLGGG